MKLEYQDNYDSREKAIFDFFNSELIISKGVVLSKNDALDLAEEIRAYYGK